MKDIAKIGGFEYRLDQSPDQRYGRVIDGNVVGMIGEVLNGVCLILK